MSEFSHTTPGAFDRPPHRDVEVTIEGPASQHAGIMTNFVEAILDHAPLLAPASEGIRSVEMANAMLLSSFDNETITLPLDGSRYEAWLADRIAESKAGSLGAIRPN
jgi:hypothetical protein